MRTVQTRSAGLTLLEAPVVTKTLDCSVTIRLRTGRERGLSLIEVLIAGGLMVVIVLGILPLFTGAMISNRSGLSATQVSNLARSRLEEYVQLPFNDLQLTIPGGSTELMVEEHFSEKDKKWKPGKNAAAGDHALFARTTTIRQFSIDSTSSTGLSAALNGDAPPLAVHLKEIQVSVLGRTGGPLGPRKQIMVRVFKAQ